MLIYANQQLQTGKKAVGAILGASFLISFALTVIMPNSFKIVSATSIVFSFIYCVIVYGRIIFSGPYFYYLYASYIITLFYLIIGRLNGAPDVAAGEVFLIYIFFPLVIGAQLTALLFLVDLKTIVRLLVYSVPVIAATVVYFFWAFRTLGPDAVRIFIETPNVVISEEGFVAATMHVYGSMIFIASGFFASPGVVRNPFLRIIIFAIIAAIAFTSGRGSLVFSMLIGLCIFAGVAFFASTRRESLSHRMLLLVLGSIVVVVGALVLQLLAGNEFGAGVVTNISDALGKLFPDHQNVGGLTRFDQLEALKHGIDSNWGLGAGHGTASFWYSDPEKPWRYELVWVATVFRTGFLGAAVYAAPFLVTLFQGARLIIGGKMDRFETFVFSGFIAAFLSSNTNPYLEAYVFQWMYILPIVYFLRRSEYVSFWRANFASER